MKAAEARASSKPITGKVERMATHTDQAAEATEAARSNISKVEEIAKKVAVAIIKPAVIGSIADKYLTSTKTKTGNTIWNCSICNAIATTQKNIDIHVAGMKHKGKVAELNRKDKDYWAKKVDVKASSKPTITEKVVEHMATDRDEVIEEDNSKPTFTAEEVDAYVNKDKIEPKWKHIDRRESMSADEKSKTIWTCSICHEDFTSEGEVDIHYHERGGHGR